MLLDVAASGLSIVVSGVFGNVYSNDGTRSLFIYRVVVLSNFFSFVFHLFFVYRRTRSV